MGRSDQYRLVTEDSTAPYRLSAGAFSRQRNEGNNMRQNFRAAAFNAVCTNATEPETWYLCLIESCQVYGGPEEGGWWQQIDALARYQEFASEKEAKNAANRIHALADQLTREASNSHSRHCERQCDWLEARGLDADYFPENDGPSYFRVWVGTELPVFDNTRETYE